MTSLIYFRFKANTKTDQIQFDGSSVSVKDLKTKIRTKCGLYAGDFDLKLEDSNGKVYEKEEDIIPKYTNLIVSRIPKPKGAMEASKKKPNIYDESSRNGQKLNLARFEAPNPLKAMNLANSNLTEEEKIKVMMEKTAETLTEKGNPPPNYTCHKCGCTGHWVHNCTGLVDSVGNQVDLKTLKRPTGIPTDFLLKVDPGTPGAFLSRDGTYSVPIKDALVPFHSMNFFSEAHAQGKKDKRPFSVEENPPYQPPQDQITQKHLQCPLCSELFRDAVMVSCCSTTYCSECITDHAFSGIGTRRCPSCGSPLTSYESNILGNTIVRKIIQDMKLENDENEKTFVNNRRVLKPKSVSSQLDQAESNQTNDNPGSMQSKNDLNIPDKNLTSNIAMNTMNVVFTGSDNKKSDSDVLIKTSNVSANITSTASSISAISSSTPGENTPGVTSHLGQVVGGMVVPGLPISAATAAPFIPNTQVLLTGANPALLLAGSPNWPFMNTSNVPIQMPPIFGREKIMSREEFQRFKDNLLERKRNERDRSRSPHRNSRYGHSRSSRRRRSNSRSPRNERSRHNRDRERRYERRSSRSPHMDSRDKDNSPRDVRRVVINKKSSIDKEPILPVPVTKSKSIEDSPIQSEVKDSNLPATTESVESVPSVESGEVVDDEAEERKRKMKKEKKTKRERANSEENEVSSKKKSKKNKKKKKRTTEEKTERRARKEEKRKRKEAKLSPGR